MARSINGCSFRLHPIRKVGRWQRSILRAGWRLRHLGNCRARAPRSGNVLWQARLCPKLDRSPNLVVGDGKIGLSSIRSTGLIHRQSVLRLALRRSGDAHGQAGRWSFYHRYPWGQTDAKAQILAFMVGTSPATGETDPRGIRIWHKLKEAPRRSMSRRTARRMGPRYVSITGAPLIRGNRRAGSSAKARLSGY